MPVVLSRRVFDGIPNIPNDTFIAADDFSSAKELATFLKQLAANLTEYKRCVRKFSVKIFEKGFKKLNFPMENFDKNLKIFAGTLTGRKALRTRVEAVQLVLHVNSANWRINGHDVS